MSGFDIGPKHVGYGAPALIVAEVAQAHEGSLSLAHAYIDAVADAGADAVKFQCHIAAAESTFDEPWRVEPRWYQDPTRYDYWKRMQFSAVQWIEMADHATKRGLIFLCSPFSVEAVQLVDHLVPAWKVASGEIRQHSPGEAIGKRSKIKQRPVIVSTGMSSCGEVDYDLDRWVDSCRDVAVLQCTSEYPTRAERVGLSVLAGWRARWTLPVGLSDHSGTIWPSLAAVTLGASIVEVHVKLSQYDQGFDASSSITIDELAKLVDGVRFIEKALKPVDKDLMAKELEPMRELFMRRHERLDAIRDGDLATFAPDIKGFDPGKVYRLE